MTEDPAKKCLKAQAEIVRVFLDSGLLPHPVFADPIDDDLEPERPLEALPLELRHTPFAPVLRQPGAGLGAAAVAVTLTDPDRLPAAAFAPSGSMLPVVSIGRDDSGQFLEPFIVSAKVSANCRYGACFLHETDVNGVWSIVFPDQTPLISPRAEDFDLASFLREGRIEFRLLLPPISGRFLLLLLLSDAPLLAHTLAGLPHDMAAPSTELSDLIETLEILLHDDAALEARVAHIEAV